MRIPGLLDVIRTDEPERIAGLAVDGRLDRHFKATGPLLNRIIAGRIRRILQLDGAPLPAVAPRDAPGRAERQAELESALALTRPPCEETHIDELAAHVLGRRDSGALGPLVQEVIARRFVPNYRASPETWEAARLLDAAPRTLNPLRQAIWTATGRVRRARRLLAEGLGNNPAAVHAVAIAAHNLVCSFERMRVLWTRPAEARRLSVEEAVARCLAAPDTVLRQATGRGATAAGEFRPGTLVAFRLEAARARTVRRDLAFMSESWSRCPAHSWVPALLATVWNRASAQPHSEERR